MCLIDFLHLFILVDEGTLDRSNQLAFFKGFREHDTLARAPAPFDSVGSYVGSDKDMRNRKSTGTQLIAEFKSIDSTQMDIDD